MLKIFQTCQITFYQVFDQYKAPVFFYLLPYRIMILKARNYVNFLHYKNKIFLY